FFTRSRVGGDAKTWCEKANWIGYVAVPKVPGILFNERLPELVKRPAEGLPWSCSHVGVELALDHKHSPFLKDTVDPSCFHNLEAHLHLLDGLLPTISTALVLRNIISLESDEKAICCSPTDGF
ncbi:unnamed protein product, partial [Musa acuminata subsp. burmannicoides]